MGSLGFRIVVGGDTEERERARNANDRDMSLVISRKAVTIKLTAHRPVWVSENSHHIKLVDFSEMRKTATIKINHESARSAKVGETFGAYGDLSLKSVSSDEVTLIQSWCEYTFEPISSRDTTALSSKGRIQSN
jgi:hypothetical protein